MQVPLPDYRERHFFAKCCTKRLRGILEGDAVGNVLLVICPGERQSTGIAERYGAGAIGVDDDEVAVAIDAEGGDTDGSGRP